MKSADILNKLVNSDHIVFTFLRSAVGSLSSAVADIGSRILFYAVVLSSMPEFYRSNLAVAIGAVIGGVVQCTVNYKFTFHASGQNVKAVAVKFFIVWGGNLLLNMYGTTLLARPLSRWDVLLDMGFTNNDIFAMTTFAVAIIVSLFWNFGMQRWFVYRPNRFDSIAEKLLSSFGHKG